LDILTLVLAFSTCLPSHLKTATKQTRMPRSEFDYLMLTLAVSKALPINPSVVDEMLHEKPEIHHVIIWEKQEGNEIKIEEVGIVEMGMSRSLNIHPYRDAPEQIRLDIYDAAILFSIKHGQMFGYCSPISKEKGEI
jgi:hypothetical protein